MTPLVLLALLAQAPAPGCPAEAQPGWATASAREKKERLAQCQAPAEVVAPVPAPAPEVQPATAAETGWFFARSVSVLVVGGAAVAGPALLGYALAGPYDKGAGLLIGALAGVVLLPFAAAGIYRSLDTKWRLGAAAGGAAVGALVGAGFGAIGFFTGMQSGGIGVGWVVATLTMPVLGALVGLEVSRASDAQVSFAPMPGGGQLLLSARF